ncbi:MAG: hypothetical protein K2X03_20020 [Bryobacteraceae bacterium]|nr:hypothetical protein [Bryobacteraceae bacterium]
MVQRIEAAFASLGARFADAGVRLGVNGAGKQAAGGGWAVFLGTGSPLSHALGANGQLTLRQLRSLEEFFFSRGADAIVEVADVWQLEPWLTGLGYELAGVEQVLLHTLTPGAYAPHAEVADCGARVEEWAQAVQVGFGMEVTATGQLLGRILGCETLLGMLDANRITATAAFALVDEFGYCFADATLPEHRGQGKQRALIEHRRWLASEGGARYCVAETAPESGSERNYLRCGFERVFLRQTFVKRVPI